ncbi:C4-dicarboxylate transporter DctA [Mycobacterium sp. KBS0706]|uniref:C4-dicarboxylate transporter DctA n=1 Tax=Mycobacterium sp. KBS0706 TaxID=2578109 RepID=UPI00110F841D|nr:C4-dicarboxylate transporter DctA [Mycobacterium sp. KBS0706]TSD83486.1 C4-dicarboxylate transporter DctA [Mycobacterium sp. KBS0706]
MTIDSRAVPPRAEKAPSGSLLGHLYVQVLCAIVLGIALGHFYPSLGADMRPLGDAFIKAIKMLVAPIIFCTVVHGIASVGDLRKVGRIGFKALVYFEAITTIALVVGLIAMRFTEPGAGLNIDPSTLQSSALQGIGGKAPQLETISDYFLHIIPDTFVGAFAEGEILQVLFAAILFSFAVHSLGDKGKPLLQVIDLTAQGFFAAVGIVMKAAPIGAFGAMAFTIGKYGIASLLPLLHLIAVYYATCLFFVFVVLGIVCRLAGFRIWALIRYLREELLIVLGTSSSEAALPRLMSKLQALGIERSVVGLVVPAGYSFNLDGTCINLTVLAIFIAQATNTDLSLAQELGLLAVLLLTSKGAASVTGGSLVVLAATLASTGIVPVAGIAIILGIYRFISEGGALVNAIGNGVAAIVVAKWEGALDEARMRRCLGRGASDEPVPSEADSREAQSRSS